MNIDWVNGFWGGVLIGVAVSLMLFWNGRVTGISGIIYGLLGSARGDRGWRLYFIFGLVLGGITLRLLRGGDSVMSHLPVDWMVPLAGLLVGFGTVLGSGCTSGHGVCGVSRMSARSLTATAVFMAAGIASVYFLRTWGVLP